MNFSKHIEDLCQKVSQEKDGEKLLSLVDELNKELELSSETLPGNTRRENDAAPGSDERNKPHAA